MNKFSRVGTLLFLTVALAACGQTTPPAGSAVTAPAAAATIAAPTAAMVPALPQNDSYAARRAALPAQAPEALAPAPPSDLTATAPGGKKLSAQALNKSVPLVLVHGLGGWGPTEFLGIPYWGGTTFQNVVTDLNSQGYNVFQASVGPISSNWERAAELYYQIKGGCVDYGKAYSARYGFSRYDPVKCYKGFYPQWDAQHPVNLLGHSMGAQTTRMLVKLLEDGSPADADGDNLYTGGRKGWVKTVMTLSGTNSGTPATDNIQAMLPTLVSFLKEVAKGFGAAANNSVYDFDLGQWGLHRQAGETLDAYAARVANSNFAKNTSNAAYDLSTDGAYELNKFMTLSPNTVYASWATSATTPGLVTGWAYPTPLFMDAPLAALAWPYPWPLRESIGNMTGSSPAGKVQYDASWWENDGLVPVKSQGAPLGSPENIYKGGPVQPGQWYNMGKLTGWDHVTVIGLLSARDVRPFFRNQAAWLASQP